ncbi:MAG: LysR substrate-binding domain-containing protein [Pseudomonadota bacterium]|nr:LysR substrate-binding domain-containing protein [Pseudomonadota bacterium]
METRHIRLIRTIALHGSISAAARELGLSQPALTKILTRVEDNVGARLFDRRARGVATTGAGRLFLERMDRIDREMRFLMADVRSLETGLAGRVAVGVGQFWIGHIVPRVVNRLRDEAPGVQVQILTGTRDQLLELLQRGEIDLMLGRFAADLPDALVAEPLADVKLYVTVRAGHPLTRCARPVTPGDLIDYPWVLPPPADPTAIHMAAMFRKHVARPIVAAVEAVSQNVVSGLLATSDMIAVLPGIAVNEPMAGLARLHCDWLDWSREAGVIRIADTPLPASSERFLRLLREAVEPVDGRAKAGHRATRRTAD